MAKICGICGKGIQFGNKVSHANKKVTKIWWSNLQRVRVQKTNGTVTHMKVCTTCIRSQRFQKPVRRPTVTV